MTDAGLFDRSVLTTNDQNNGEVSDITKIENIQTYIADLSDANYNYVSGLISAGTLSKLSIINVKDYGVKGDGVTDDYAAIKKVFDLISNGFQGQVIFPDGTYYIDQVRTATNGITDLSIIGGSNFSIIGIGAKIKCKGGFTRTATTDATVTPFYIKDCSYFSIEGFECDGQNTTIVMNGQGESLSGQGGCGIELANNRNYRIRNCYFHHFITDGIFERGHKDDSSINKNAVYESVVCEYNGRQGISIIQLANASFLSCSFDKTGTSTYGYHSPGSGVDIEPTRDDAIEKTGNITFTDCSFLDNIRSAFLASRPSRTENVSLYGCRTNNPNNYDFPVSSVIQNITYENCTIDCGTDVGSFYPSGIGGDLTAAEYLDARAEVRNCTIYSSKRGIYSVTPSPLLISNCNIISTHTAPEESFFPYFDGNTLCVIEDCYIFLAAAMYDAVNDTGGVTRSKCKNIKRASNNRWDTDLTDGGTSNHFAIDFDFANAVAPVINQYFSNTQIRPNTNAAFPINTPWATGYSSVGRLSINRFDSPSFSNTIVFGSAAPTSGTWKRGDIVFNYVPSAGGVAHWRCTAAGTPGTWIAVQGGILTSISATPLGVGFFAVVAGVGYMSTGTSSTADWKQVTP